MAVELKFLFSVDDQSGPGFANAKRNLEGVANAATMSAKQTDAAMRQIAPQVTDMVTQLAGGQNALLVMIQQGGQLKDQLGGVLPAAKALGGYLIGLVNPLSIVAAGAAAVGFAYYQGSQESREFNKQLALTGNIAGVSSSQLMMMAASHAAATGSQHEAAEVLALLVGTGKIAAEQFGVIADAATGMARATGQPIKSIVDDFVALGDEPVKASQKLNSAHHYLTLAIFEQIRALEEQGDKSGAAALAQKTYASAMERTTQQITGNLGALERSWDWVTKAAKAGWNAMLGIGRDQTGAEQLAKLQKELAIRESRDPKMMGDGWEVGNQKLRAQIALLTRVNDSADANAKRDAERQRQQDAAIAASSKVKAREDKVRGKSAVQQALDDYERDLTDIRKGDPNSASLDPKTVAAVQAQIRKEYGGSQKKPSEAPIDADIGKLRAQYEAEERALKQTLTAIKADYDMGLSTAREYLDRQFEAKQNALQRELGIAQKQEELARGKRNVAAVERYSADVKRITDEMQANWVNHGLAVDQLSAKVQRAVRAYQDSLDAAYNTRQQGMDDQLQGAGLGSRALEELQRMTTLRREVDKRREELRRDRQKGEEHGGIGEAQYTLQLADLEQYYTDRLVQERGYNAKSQQLRGEWTVGAGSAVATYLESAQDIAGQTNSVFSRAFSSMEDALLSFVQTGKLNFKELTNSIIADLLRMQIRAQVSGILGGNGSVLSLMGSLGGANASLSYANAVGSTGGDAIGALIAASGWSSGGYTGDGGRLEPAGIVHRGEYVLNAASTRAVGLDALDRLNRFSGYAAGGLVGGPAGRAPSSAAMAAGSTGGMVYAPVTHLTVGERDDRAAILADTQRLISANNRAQQESLKRLGVIPA